MTHTTSSPKSRHGSPSARAGSATMPTTPTFFIIQEPNVVRSSPPSPITSEMTATSATPTPSPNLSRGDLEKQRHALASRQSHPSMHSLSSGTPGPRRRRDRVPLTGNDTSAILHEETEHDLLGDDDGNEREAPSASPATTTPTPQPRGLSILNRCGSSPDLPLHNSWSSTVFMPSKKRQLLKPSHGNGASPHLAAMQRSRLIPLPINIRTGTLKKMRDEETQPRAAAVTRTMSLGSLRDPQLVVTTGYDDAQDVKLNYEITITSLKERLTRMEKASVKALKQRQALEKQVDALTTEQRALHGDKAQLAKKLQDLEASNLHYRNACDKLSERYSTVYSNLAKMTEIAAASTGGKGDLPHHVASMHLVIQTMARENHELHRKVQVLETRHADDKVVVANQEKQIKRLRAEMEALHHMAAGSKDDSGGSFNAKQSQVGESGSSGGFSAKATTSRPEALVSQSASLAPPAQQMTAAGVAPQSEEAAYIDPNILKVLEKVDSQFSITNAITLAAVLKKWLHSCLHIVASTDLHGVLHVLLKRVCELLHCHHAAIFHVDYSAKKLIGVASERGLVRWAMPLDKGILGHAARYNVLCNVRNAYDDARFFSASDTITGTKSREVLCIPITRELDAFQPDPTSSVSTPSSSVFAVLQCWNTSTQKPFAQNDHILGGLLAIHAGVVLSQTKLSDNLQRVHNRVLHINHMDAELAPKALAPIPHPDGGMEATPAVSIVHLVRAAQRKFAEIVGITKLRIFVLDSDVMKVWHVGVAKLDAGATMSIDMQLQPIRKYACVHSSLCGLMLVNAANDQRADHADGADTITGCRILLDPCAEPSFNDTVDLKGGAHGLYIAPIRSPWRDLPLGMIQVARSGTALGHASSIDARPVSTTTKKERKHAQDVDDALTMELIELFCKQFASLLHHALALQIHDACPREVLDARLSHLSDRLDLLESEFLKEQEEAEREAAAIAKQSQDHAAFQRRLLESAQRGDRRAAKATTPSNSEVLSQTDRSVLFDPVPLISTDSSYAIELQGDERDSPREGSEAESTTTPDEGDKSSQTSLSPSETQPF